jgi:hypothetical protein
MPRSSSVFLRVLALGPALVAGLAQACSANGNAPQTSQGPLRGNEGVGSGLVDTSDQSDGLAEGEGNAPDRTCLGETRAAEAIALDIFIMLDSSGSMLDVLPRSTTTLLQTTKWDAVRQSLERFVQSAETEDIGIGLQYFPLVETDVPFSCETNDDCGDVAGPCSNSLCVVDETQPGQGNTPALTYTRLPPGAAQNCFDDGDCAGAADCRVMLGECIVRPGTFADLPDGAFINLEANANADRITPLCAVQGDCAGLPGTACEQIGICEDRVNLCTPSIACPAGSGGCLGVPSACVNQTKCDAADYATPDVPISSGADRGALVASLRARQPNGLTPTGPALQGALDQARAWADQNPGRQVVTVLATDGFPTECDPVDVPEIAELASEAASSPEGVKTFVIGVFSDIDLGQDGQARLNALARAGGTGEAFVVNTTRANVADEFLNALNVIRTTAVGCEFRLDADAALDLERVNLKVTSGGAERQLFNVANAAACGAGNEGWYYVRDTNGDPLQINVCPGVCADFMTGSVRVDLEIGCATLIR